MPSLQEALSDKIAWGGGGIFMPNSAVLTLHTAQANQNPFVAPCGGKIIVAEANLIEAPGTAAAVLQFGKYGSATFFGSHSFATTDSTGRYNLLADLTVTTVNQGDVIVFGTDGAATTTGLVAVTLVINPYDLP